MTPNNYKYDYLSDNNVPYYSLLYYILTNYPTISLQVIHISCLLLTITQPGKFVLRCGDTGHAKWKH